MDDAPSGYDGYTQQGLTTLKSADPQLLSQAQTRTLAQFDDVIAKQEATKTSEGVIGANSASDKITVPTVDSFEKSKYDIAHTTYPTDLMTNKKYGNNYAIYFINEYDGITTKGKNNSVPANMGIYKQSADSLKGLATMAASGATIIFGSDALDSLGGMDFAGATRKRLKTAIALPIPNDVSFSDSWSWAEEDSFKTAAAINSLAAGDEDANKNLFMKSSSAAALALISAKQPVLAAQSRQAINPKQEVLFSGVTYRTFTHSFQFAARSQEEADAIYEIYKTFRYSASPDYVDSASFVYVYPSDFDIQYYHGTKQNKYIPKHTSCVLTSVTTNYSPNSSFATFAGGAPIMISLTLNFKELATVSKVEIAEGY